MVLRGGLFLMSEVPLYFFGLRIRARLVLTGLHAAQEGCVNVGTPCRHQTGEKRLCSAPKLTNEGRSAQTEQSRERDRERQRGR